MRRCERGVGTCTARTKRGSSSSKVGWNDLRVFKHQPRVNRSGRLSCLEELDKL